MEQYIIYSIGSIHIEFNQIIFYLIISSLLIISLELPLRGGIPAPLEFAQTNKIISNSWTILIESLYRTILNMVENYLGLKNLQYFPLIFTLFHLILFSNFIGLIPYSSTTTVEFIITLTISFILLIGILI